MKELLERERELAAIEELLGRRSGILTIEVGVGIGKTYSFRQRVSGRKTLAMTFCGPAGLNLKRTSHLASCANCSSGDSQAPERMSAHQYL